MILAVTDNSYATFLVSLNMETIRREYSGNELDNPASVYTDKHQELSAEYELDDDLQMGFTANDRRDMRRMGKKQQFRVRDMAFETSRGLPSNADWSVRETFE